MQSFNFFTELEPNRNIKIGISPLVGKVSNKLYSHKGGWPVMLCDQLKHAGYNQSEVIYDSKKDWSDYDVVLIEHGMEYKGTFNVFGGSSDDLANQVLRLFSNTRLYSLHCDMPDIGAFVRSRMKAGTPYFKTLEARLDEFTSKSNSIARVDFIEKTDGQVFGDSHSFSLYEPGFTCTRYDGLTMYGALNTGISDYVFPWAKSLKVYIGNIDIRHHLMRQQDPLASIDDLITRLEQQLLSLNISDITVRHVLPVEDESRKIPGSGFYKKTAFFGSQQERAAISSYMNGKITNMCERNNWGVYSNPTCFFEYYGNLKFPKLTFDVMERPGSVHISREFHLWNYEQRSFNQNILQL
jgi:hypothetical protein